MFITFEPPFTNYIPFSNESYEVMKLKYPLHICLKMKILLWNALIYVIF